MRYEIKGDFLPVVICKLNPGETLMSRTGAMGWMSNTVIIDDDSSKYIEDSLSKQSIFLDIFTCKDNMGTVAFPSSFPGKILAKHLNKNESIICQKNSFLASESSIKIEPFFNQKIPNGFFKCENFILQKISGPGIIFIAFDGYVEEYTLFPNDTLKVDTGHVGMFDSSISFSVPTLNGFKSKFSKNKGFLLSTLTGPGKVYLQTMPIKNLARELSSFINMPKNPSD